MDTWKRLSTFGEVPLVKINGSNRSMACPPGYILNPRTLRCISMRGRTVKQLAEQGNIPYYYHPEQRKTQKRIDNRGSSKRTVRWNQPYQQIRESYRKQAREQQAREPYQQAREPYREQRRDGHSKPCLPFQIRNPITRRCILINGKTYNKIIPYAAHAAKQDEPFRYKQLPPSSWKIYIASDTRSGPNFASVMFVDITKVVLDSHGRPYYPPECIAVDLGFIPISIAGTNCSPQKISDLIESAAKSHKLLEHMYGTWIPTAGFPHKKHDWNEQHSIVRQRINDMCKELVNVIRN